MVAVSVEEGGAIFATGCIDRALPDTNCHVLAGKVEDVMEVSTQERVTSEWDVALIMRMEDI